MTFETYLDGILDSREQLRDLIKHSRPNLVRITLEEIEERLSGIIKDLETVPEDKKQFYV